MLTCEKPTKRKPNGSRGTQYGAKLHRKAGDPLCDECREAEKERYRKAYDKKQDKIKESWRTPQEDDLICEAPSHKFPQGARGTVNGYARHYNAGEDPCDECREACRIESGRRWHKVSHLYAEKKREYQAAYRQRNREAILEADRKRYRDDPGSFNNRTRERRQKIRIATDGHSWNDLSAHHGSTCYLCGLEVDLELEHGWSDSKSEDHVIPVHLEDSPGDVIENVRWTHMRCNLRKGRKTIDQLELPMTAPGHDKYGMEIENG